MKTLKNNIFIALIAITSGISLMGCTQKLTMVPFNPASHAEQAQAMFTAARIPADAPQSRISQLMPSALEGTTDPLASHNDRIGQQTATVFLVNNEIAGIALYSRQRTRRANTELFKIDDLIMTEGYERYEPKAIQCLEETAAEMHIMRMSTWTRDESKHSFELRNFTYIDANDSTIMIKNLTPSFSRRIIDSINPFKRCKK